MPVDRNLYQYLQEEFARVGPQLLASTQQLTGDVRVGNFTAPDQIEILLRLIDPTSHETSRDPGRTIVQGVPVSARAANYAQMRIFPERLQGKTVQEIAQKAETELNELQAKIVEAVHQKHPGADEYVKYLTRFTALYFAADQIVFPPSVDYITPFNEKITVRGFSDKVLSLGSVESGLVEIAPGLRAVASLKSLIGSGTSATFVDKNPYVTAVLKDYADVMGISNVEIIKGDVQTTQALVSKGTIIVRGLHNLSDIEILTILEKISEAMPAGGKLYFVDSEVEKPGMRSLVESGLTQVGLAIEHQALFTEKQGFEFIAGK